MTAARAKEIRAFVAAIMVACLVPTVTTLVTAGANQAKLEAAVEAVSTLQEQQGHLREVVASNKSLIDSHDKALHRLQGHSQ